MKFKITKEFNFCASHKLLNLPEEHPCTKLHGHNYKVIVELSSDTLTEAGMVVDYHEMATIKTFIDNEFDHTNLNDHLRCSPTAENLAGYLYESIKEMNFPVSKVTVCETPNTSASYECSNN